MKKYKMVLFTIICFAISLFFTNNVFAADDDKACPASALQDELKPKPKYISGRLTQYGRLYLYDVPTSLYAVVDGSDGTKFQDTDVNFWIEGQPLADGLKKNEGAYVRIYFYLKEAVKLKNGDTDCTYPKNTKVYTMYFYDGSELDNPWESNTICTNFKNTVKGYNNSYLTKKAKELVPECYYKKGNNISPTKKEVQTAINEFLAYADIVKKAGTTSDTSNGNPKATNSLQCNYYSSEKNVVTKSYSETTTTLKGCQQTCKETVRVTFDPPVATQSGMCFSYVAEIKSVVNCESKFLRPYPTSEMLCYDVPTCKHADGTGETSGPNEEFDACIEKCDNKNYTQSCINKCYEDVYGEELFDDSDLAANVEDIDMNIDVIKYEDSKAKVETLANESNPVCIKDEDLDSGKFKATPANIQKLVELKRKYPGGYVTTYGNWHKTSKASSCPSDISAYYFRNYQAAAAYVELLSKNYFSYYKGIIGIAENDVYVCGSECKFEGCDNNKLAVTRKANLSGGTSDISTLENAQQEWKDDRDACLYGQVCRNNVANFEITVDQETTTTNKDIETHYTATHNQGTDKVTNNSVYELFNKDATKHNQETMNGANNTNSIVTAFSGICMNGKTEYTGASAAKDCQTTTTTTSKTDGFVTGTTTTGGNLDNGVGCYAYRDVVTFPQTYIDNKTGAVKHDVANSDKKYYTYVGNQFCTRISAVAVNTDWYDWKVNKNNDAIAEANANTKNNIKITIKGNGSNGGFGLYGWNFDLNCFYAIDNPSDTTTPSKDYIFRSVDLTNLFPDNRTPGFNWSEGAINEGNADYKINPTKLINNIQETGNSIFYVKDTTDEDIIDDRRIATNTLDYYFVLDSREDFEFIRNSNIEDSSDDIQKKSSFSSTNNNRKTYGVTVYKSAFLDSLSGEDGIMRKRGLIGCNNQTSASTCEGS